MVTVATVDRSFRRDFADCNSIVLIELSVIHGLIQTKREIWLNLYYRISEHFEVKDALIAL